jgi:hypothetical protein
LLIAALACADHLVDGNPESPANVETIVAATFQALTQSRAAFATLQPGQAGRVSSVDVFSHNDGAGQRKLSAEKDGVTIHSPFEPAEVSDYDVSPVDGSIVYVSINNYSSIR